jgi:DNA-binding Lrp family transcriptional regulator
MAMRQIRLGKRKWDVEAGFLLFCAGHSYSELANRFKVSFQAVSEMAKREGWLDKRDAILAERALRVGVHASKEQEFIRAQECRMARQALGLLELAMRKVKVNKPKVGDIRDLAEMVSRLGRMGSGLPLNQVEVTVTHDLNEELRAALARAYPGEAPAIDVPGSAEGVLARIPEKSSLSTDSTSENKP